MNSNIDRNANFYELLCAVRNLNSFKPSHVDYEGIEQFSDMTLLEVDRQNSALAQYNIFKQKLQYLNEIEAIIPYFEMMVQIYETIKKPLSQDVYKAQYNNVSNCLKKMSLYYQMSEITNLHTLLTLIQEMCELCMQNK